ncbi:MAG TPA: flippase [bacterium]|nr:flippase [bacterium]
MSEGRARRVTWNSLSLSSAEILSRVFTWVTLLVLARYWSRDYYGQYAIAVNWVMILSTLTGLGFGSLAVRDVSHDRSLSNFYLRNIIQVRILTTLVSLVVLAVVGPALHYEPVLCTALLVMGLRLIFEAPSNGYIMLFQAHEKMAYTGLVSLGGAFLRMAGIVAVAYLGGEMVGACWVWVAASALSLVFLWAHGRKQGWRVDWKEARWKDMWGILVRSIPFAAFGTFQMLYYRVDAVILKSFSGNEMVALYDMAGRFLFVVFMLSDHFGIATLPVYSIVRDRPDEIARVMTRSLKFLIMAGLPITVGGFLLAGPLMTVLLGSRYSGAGPAFSVLAISIVLHFASKAPVNLLAVKDVKRLTTVFMTLFILNVAANFYAIPHWGLMGAAWVSSACEMLFLGWVLWIVRSYLLFSKFGVGRGMVASILASAVMGSGIFRDPRLYWIIAGPLIYILCLWVFRAFDSEDVSSLKSLTKV